MSAGTPERGDHEDLIFASRIGKLGS